MTVFVSYVILLWYYKYHYNSLSKKYCYQCSFLTGIGETASRSALLVGHPQLGGHLTRQTRCGGSAVLAARLWRSLATLWSQLPRHREYLEPSQLLGQRSGHQWMWGMWTLPQSWTITFYYFPISHLEDIQ